MDSSVTRGQRRIRAGPRGTGSWWVRAVLVGVAGLLVLAGFTPRLVGLDLTQVRTVQPSYPLTVLAVRPGDNASGSLTLSTGVDAAEPGQFRLAWATGSAVVGDVVAATASGVSRTYTDEVGTSLRTGLRVGIQPGRYLGTPLTALGLAFSAVAVPTALGAMPAWFVPAAPSSPVASTWVLLVHGLGGSRTDTLAMMPLWHSLGYPQLAISYRNDLGAPRSSDHRSHLGASEWHDVDSAVGFAVSHGASHVILQGYSQGGAMALLAASHGANRSQVSGVVLDSPVLDWRATLAYGAGKRGLPGVTASIGCLGLSWVVGDVCGTISMTALAASLQRPVLLVQGLADRIVPPTEAQRFAQRRPDLVSYLPVPGADHVSAIDVAPLQYFDALSTFARRVQGS